MNASVVIVSGVWTSRSEVYTESKGPYQVRFPGMTFRGIFPMLRLIAPLNAQKEGLDSRGT
jgi:hypothetical protein